MMKKAQGMSMKVIIIAVIAMIVLVVLVLIFTGKVRLFSTQTTKTASQYTGNTCEIPGTGNECMDEYECDRLGGSWSAPPEEGYEDCWEGCCSL